MSMHRAFSVASVLCLTLAASSLAAPGPNLGRQSTPEEIAPWDISIPTGGAGLPTGSGTATQGEAIFNAQCAACHGLKGVGNPNEPPSPVSATPLAGGQGTLAGEQPLQTVGSYWPYATTLFDYIRRAMPWASPKSLTDQDVYSLTAYILSLNGLIGENDVIDARTLPKVQMPNRNNFITIPKGTMMPLSFRSEPL
jgi:mono/diheme cytochrome c family protein